MATENDLAVGSTVDDAPAAGAPAAAPAPGVRPGGASRLLIGLLVVVAGIAIALGVVLGIRWNHSSGSSKGLTALGSTPREFWSVLDPAHTVTSDEAGPQGESGLVLNVGGARKYASIAQHVFEGTGVDWSDRPFFLVNLKSASSGPILLQVRFDNKGDNVAQYLVPQTKGTWAQIAFSSAIPAAVKGTADWKHVTSLLLASDKANRVTLGLGLFQVAPPTTISG